MTGNYIQKKHTRYPVDYFQKVFRIASAEVKRARLYCTACGIYRGLLNQEKIGDDVLMPGHTDYRKRIQYQVYDVTEQLKDGENTISFELADGWYRGSVGAWGMQYYYGSLL